MQVKRKEGGTATQPSRIIGINGPRWLLRATFLGKPAVEPDAAGDWEDAVTRVAVRRGDQAMRGGRAAAGDPARPGPPGRTADPLAPCQAKSRLRRTISSWASSTDQHARDLRRSHQVEDGTPIADAPDRELVQLRGTLRTVTLRPRGGVPALEAELDDGSGVLTIVWLGRRRIAGIGPGRSLQVQGRIGVHDGHRIMYNPRYELIP